MKSLLFVCLVHIAVAPAYSQAVFRIDSLPQRGVMLNKNWKWHKGDNLAWAKPEFDDSHWDTLDPTLSGDVPLAGAELGWFRLTFAVDSSLLNQPFIIDVTPIGALEIYLNGKWIHTSGRVSKDPAIEEPVSGDINPPNVVFSQPVNTLAVRYSFTKAHWGLFDHWAFRLILVRLDGFIEEARGTNVNYGSRYGFISGLILMLALVHFSLYYFYRAQRANLLFGIALLALAMGPVALTLLHNILKFLEPPFWHDTLSMIAISFQSAVFPIVALTAIYLYLQRPYSVFYWGLVGLYALFWLIVSWNTKQFFSLLPLASVLALCTFLNYLYVSYQATRKKVRSAHFILYGGLTFVGLNLFMLVFNAIYFVYYPKNNLALSDADFYGSHWISYGIAVVQILQNAIIPFSISLSLARDFAQTSFSLEEKLAENEHLFAEKQQLLTTQNERLEQQVEVRTAQLNQSLKDLRTTQAQLIQKEKLASLGELTAGIAHEIQNPLNFVNNFSEVSSELVDELKEGPFEQLSDSDKEYATGILGDLTQNLQKITQHGQRASNIIKGMLEHSRSSTGELQSTDLNALADEYLCLAYQGQRAKDKDFNCELVTHFDPAIGQVDLMSQEIGRVLLNLFTNAFYAVRERQKQANSHYQPSVTVSTTKTKGGIEIRVADNGTGMADSVKTKIFQPFFTTKPTGEGTGLGLSLSYDVITKGHGGKMEVESQPGEGTQMIVRLPT